MPTHHSFNLTPIPPLRLHLLAPQRHIRNAISHYRRKRFLPIQQIYPFALLRRQTPLRRLKQFPPRWATARKPHSRPALGALDVKGNINITLDLIHRATNPGYLAPEVDVVAEDAPRAGVGAEGVHGRGHNWRGRLFVVEEGEGGDGDDDGEDGEGAGPVVFDLGEF